MRKLFVILLGGLVSLNLLIPAAALAQSSGGNNVRGGLNQIKGSFGSSTINDTQNVEQLISLFIRYALGFGAVCAVVFIIYGGFQYITAGGNETQAKTGRRTLTYAIIGLTLCLVSFAIVSILTEFITSTDTGGGVILP